MRGTFFCERTTDCRRGEVMSEVIGNFSEAYNIGRTELLAWLNELLQLNYVKIEQVSNGLLIHHLHQFV